LPGEKEPDLKELTSILEEMEMPNSIEAAQKRYPG
jgi:hypothetical protein